MLNGREGGRERDIRSDTWESSHSGIGFIEFDNEFKMKQPFVIMIMNWTVWKSPKNLVEI